MVSKKPPNDTSKEERSYEPFQGARLDYIRNLAKKEKEELEAKEKEKENQKETVQE